MYERPRVNVEVEGGSTLTYMRDRPYNVSILYTRELLYARIIYVRTHGKITRQWKSTFKFLRFVFQILVMWQYSREVPLSNVVLLCA